MNRKVLFLAILLSFSLGQIIAQDNKVDTLSVKNDPTVTGRPGAKKWEDRKSVV